VVGSGAAHPPAGAEPLRLGPGGALPAVCRPPQGTPMPPACLPLLPTASPAPPPTP
jgi:hypothetical protein